MYSVNDFYKQFSKQLRLELVTGQNGLKRSIEVPEAHRPGLALSGFFKGYVKKRLLVIGEEEIEYLKSLSVDNREERLTHILTDETPALFIARKYMPTKEIKKICDRNDLPVFCSELLTLPLLMQLNEILTEEFNSTTCHGTLLEVHGVGILIKGESSMGKSETALELIKRGQRLISDDAVVIKKLKNGLTGLPPQKLRHHMNIRGVGIINISELHGVVAVKDEAKIDLVVQLEEWNQDKCYDNGVDDHCDILGIKIPHYTLPVNGKRDLALFIETIALKHRFKMADI
jgi:HPr kinase/phosphorylase